MADPPATPAPGDDPRDSGDAALVARLQAGDEGAYEEMVRANIGPMLSVARRFVRNDDDAQDAVQDAFLSAFRNIDRFQGGARLSTWLHRIVVNASLMKLRSARRRPARSIEELLPRFGPEGHPLEPAAKWQPLPDAGIQSAELAERVRSMIDELPEPYRVVLLLRDIEGLDTAQTAAQLGINEGAVKTRLHRARQALRQLLEPHVQDIAP